VTRTQVKEVLYAHVVPRVGRLLDDGELSERRNDDLEVREVRWRLQHKHCWTVPLINVPVGVRIHNESIVSAYCVSVGTM
jgi:hypothetical protein